MPVPLESVGPALRDMRTGVRDVLARGLAAAAARSRWPQPGLGIDRHTGRVVQIPWAWLRQHVLCVGANGVGKTTTCTRLAAAVISNQLPCLVLDLKGDPGLAAELAAWAAAAGRPFLRLELGAEHTRYDPMHGGDASERASKLVGFQSWSEPHYLAVAQDLVTLAIRVADASQGARADLAGITQLLRVAALKDAAQGGAVPLPLAREVSEEIQDLPRDQTSAIAGLRRRLRGITASSAGPALVPSSEHPTIDLHEALRPGGPVVVCSLNSMRYGGLAGSVAAMVLEDLRAALSHRADTDVPGLCWIDEFEDVAGPGLGRLLSRARSSGVGVMLSTQDLSDLRRVDEHLPEQMLGNARSLIVHRVTNPRTAELLADVIATDEVWEDTHQVDRDTLGTQRPTGAGSRRAVHHYAIHPSELKRLGMGSAVVAIHSEADGPAHLHRTQVRPLRAPGQAA